MIPASGQDPESADRCLAAAGHTLEGAGWITLILWLRPLISEAHPLNKGTVATTPPVGRRRAVQ